MLAVDANHVPSHSSQGSLFFAPSPVFVILSSLIIAFWMMVKYHPMVALIYIKSLISVHLKLNVSDLYLYMFVADI